jgi:hypothetical protein
MMKRFCILSIIVLIVSSCTSITSVTADETVYVKYRGPLNLKPFKCESTPRSSLVKRVCYDEKEQYVVVKLQDVYYHYCEVPDKIVSKWLEAESLGRYYNQNVKGKYDCRVNYMPQYEK